MRVILQLQVALDHYQKLAQMLSRAQPEKQPELAQLYAQYKAAAAATVRVLRCACPVPGCLPRFPRWSACAGCAVAALHDGRRCCGC